MIFHDVFFFQAEDGIRDAQESRGLGDVYKRQSPILGISFPNPIADQLLNRIAFFSSSKTASLM